LIKRNKASRDKDKGDVKKLQTWANDIRLAHTQDGHDYSKLDGMVEWCQHDDFWKSNILSGSKLRHQFDQMKAQATTRNRKGSSRATVHETMPAWAQRDSAQQDKPKPLSADKQAELNARMDRLREQHEQREQEATS